MYEKKKPTKKPKHLNKNPYSLSNVPAALPTQNQRSISVAAGSLVDSPPLTPPCASARLLGEGGLGFIGGAKLDSVITRV